jgi:hypothetical protein
VIAVRRELKDFSALGDCGAAAIRWELQRRHVQPLPSVRTMGRILERRGVLDGPRRVRRPPPPRGWYLPKVAARRAELDSFDVVEGLVIRGGIAVEVLNGISLHGGLPVSWPKLRITAKTVVHSLLAHWRRFGLPTYAQFDNDTVFQGAHQHPNAIGRVTRLCLSLGVTPVFTPPLETGFQAAIENFNGRWQAKVWSRFAHTSRRSVQSRSAKFITASRRRSAAKIENAPRRRPFPKNWQLDLQAPLAGCIVFLRRTDAKGRVKLLGYTFPVDAYWPHRLVRADVDLSHGRIRFYALRRRDPSYQPLLHEAPHVIPQRRFHD